MPRDLNTAARLHEYESASRSAAYLVLLMLGSVRGFPRRKMHEVVEDAVLVLQRDLERVGAMREMRDHVAREKSSIAPEAVGTVKTTPKRKTP